MNCDGASIRLRDALPNGLELSCPAEAGSSSLLYGTPTGQASCNWSPARRVSFSELLGSPVSAFVARFRTRQGISGIVLKTGHCDSALSAECGPRPEDCLVRSEETIAAC